MKAASKRLGSWLRDLWEKSIPARRTRQGASWGAAVVLLLLTGFMGSRLMSSLGGPVDILLGLAIGLSLMGLLGAAAGWAARLLRALPRFLDLAGTGALLLLLLLFLRFRFPASLAVLFAVALVLVEAVLGGALAVVTAAGFKQESLWKKTGVIVALVLAVAANLGIVGWLVTAGTETHLAEMEAAAPTELPALEAPDPAQPGPFTVRTLTYGSGTDRHRREFSETAELQTNPVDATPFVKGFKGWRKKFRKWYWGFDTDSFPLNGRVWYPEGEGPFPLVLIVHGNHHMAEYSDPGYAYLGELLASRGFILVSVDENFLNGSFVGGIPRENDARGWLLLQHLKTWKSWHETEGNPFSGKVDLENIGLIGHSRGGEAAAIAGAFNRLNHYPDDATVEFDFGFALKALVAIAPSDGQYRPADKPTPLADVNYLVLQGGHDSDVTLFVGDRQYNRVRFTGPGDWFKASVYIYRANHGQFNTVWGRTDFSPPFSWLLNLKPLMTGEEQRQAGKVFLSAFLEATLHGDRRYRPLFRDHRLIRGWLPENIYVTRYEDTRFRPVSDYEEDIDVTTTTLAGGGQQADGLTLWREQDVNLRHSASRRNNAVYLGWNTEDEKEEGKPEEKEQEEADEEAGSAAAAHPPSYSITLPRGVAAEWNLGPGSHLVFALAEASEEPPKPEKEDEAENQEAAEPDEEEEEKEEEERKEPLDLTVELVTRTGVRVPLPLSHFRRLPPVLKVHFAKSSWLEKEFGGESEPVFQTFELPLLAFVEAGSRFDPAELETIRFVFDRSPKGVVILDRVGFAP